jgi:hypothetical protein
MMFEASDDDLGRSAAPPLLAQPHLLGELRTCRGIIGRDHRVISRQVPLRAILIRRHPVLAQVALQRFELLSIFQTDKVFGCDRAFYRNSRFERLRQCGGSRAFGEAHQCRIHLADQGRNLRAGDSVVANISAYDLGGQLDTTGLVGVISHVGSGASRSRQALSLAPSSLHGNSSNGG